MSEPGKHDGTEEVPATRFDAYFQTVEVKQRSCFCEYCGRKRTHDGNCDGCGAPLSEGSEP